MDCVASSQESSKSYAEFGWVFCLCASASLVCQRVLKFLGGKSSSVQADLLQQSYSRTGWVSCQQNLRSCHIESETLTKMLIGPNYQLGYLLFVCFLFSIKSWLLLYVSKICSVHIYADICYCFYLNICACTVWRCPACDPCVSVPEKEAQAWGQLWGTPTINLHGIAIQWYFGKVRRYAVL